LEPITPDDAVVAPFLADLDQVDAFRSLNDPAVWTLPILRERAATRFTRRQGCHAQLYLIRVLPILNENDQWSILAATDTLGRVDAATLTVACLRELLRHLGILHKGVLGRIWTTQPVFDAAVASRRSSLRGLCGAIAADYDALLDRAADRLRPLLGA
jgi:hypothetical protein